MFSHTEGFNADKKVSVQLFLLVQSGTYTEQMIRPFETNVARGLRDALTEATQGGLNVGISAVEGVAGDILRPQFTTQGEAHVVNGWRTRRFRFMMKVLEYNPAEPHQQIKRIFFGYSDAADLSHTGRPDPNMRIYFNSETTLSCTYETSPQGGYWNVRPIGSNQIVSPVDMANAPGVTTAFGHNTNFLIRPDDIFYHGHSQQAVEKLRQFGNFGNGPVEILDQRSTVSDGTMYQYSRRHDASPSRYLHKTLLGYQHAHKENVMEGNFGYDKASLYREAGSRIANDHIHKVSFFQLLKTQAGYMEKGFVTLAELSSIFPEVSSEQVTPPPGMDTGQSIRRVNQAEDSEHWRGSNEITVAASSIAQILPAIMMDNLLRYVAINVTNGHGPGNYRMSFADNNSVRAIEDNLYLAPHLAEFERRLGVDLLNVITRNNQISFELSVGCDISGDTVIMLRLGAEGPIRWVAPTFVDSLFTPVVTNDRERADKISTDLLYLLDEVIPEPTISGVAYNPNIPAFDNAVLTTSSQTPDNNASPTSSNADRYTGLI
jgi:hypothetical protein